MSRGVIHISIAAALLVACSSSDAAAPAMAASSGGEVGQGEDEDRDWHELRADARAACEGLEAGVACSFEGRRGDVEGICRPGRRGEGLACRRDGQRAGRGRPGGDRGRWGGRDRDPEQSRERREAMMAAATEACASLAEGDGCSFEGPRGETSGTCRPSRGGEGLACRGAGPRRRGPGRPGTDDAAEP